VALQYLNGAYKKVGEGLFTREWSDRTRGNVFFRLDARKKFFTLRVVRYGLPRQAVDALSLATFKVRLDGALSHLVSWKVSLLMAEGIWN